MTVRQYFQRDWRKGRAACEYDPMTGRPATLDGEFHGEAEVTMGRPSKLDAMKDRQLRVCRACSQEGGCLAVAFAFGGKKQPEMEGGRP